MFLRVFRNVLFLWKGKVRDIVVPNRIVSDNGRGIFHIHKPGIVLGKPGTIGITTPVSFESGAEFLSLDSSTPVQVHNWEEYFLFKISMQILLYWHASVT